MTKLQTTITLLVAIAVAILFGNGCVNQLIAGAYDRYYDSGFRAEAKGDYFTARNQYLKALWNVQAGFLGAEAESGMLYDVARMNGLLGNFEVAEKQFKDA